MKKLAIVLGMLLLVGCQTTEMRADKDADISANSKVNYINSESLKDEKKY